MIKKLKELWEKIKAWWKASKIKPIVDKIGKAIVKFLHYAYAAQISYLVLAVLFYLTTSKFAGVLLIAWGVVMVIAEYRQHKSELNPQPEPPKPDIKAVKPATKKN